MNTEQLKRDPMKETEQTLLEIPDIISSLSIPSVGPTEFAQKCRWLREQMDLYATAKAKASCEATLKKAFDNCIKPN